MIRCLEAYAKATRVEGKAKNVQYENIKGCQFQKDWLRTYDLNMSKKTPGP